MIVRLRRLIPILVFVALVLLGGLLILGGLPLDFADRPTPNPEAEAVRRQRVAQIQLQLNRQLRLQTAGASDRESRRNPDSFPLLRQGYPLSGPGFFAFSPEAGGMLEYPEDELIWLGMAGD